MEADFWLWRLRRRLKQWAQLLKNLSERDIVDEKCFVNFSQPLKDGGIRRRLFAHSDESPYDVHAHGHSPLTIEEIGGHQSTMLRESVWQIFAVPTPAFV